MLLKILLSQDKRKEELFKKSISSLKIEKEVSNILKKVEEEKDRAILKFTEKFDGVKLTLKDLSVKKEEIKEAYKIAEINIINSLKIAIYKIYQYHKNRYQNKIKEKTKEKIIPIEKIGVYIPGGKAGTTPLVSSVLMNVIPAKIAGCKEIIMCTAPQKNKKINPYLLIAADLVKVNKIFKIGGAQAIAALTYGTKIIPSVDKIIGPGNIYVTLAKKLVFGKVDIDILAGPSEILIIADNKSNPSFIAADLLAQAEHGEDTRVFLITTSRKIANLVNQEIKEQLKKLTKKEIIKKSLKSGFIIIVKNLKEAISLANKIAPEHLELMIKNPENLLKNILNAGAIFLGPYSPVVVGDYIAGPSHVLPTNGTARFSSGLGVEDFFKRTSIIKYTKNGLQKIKEHIFRIADLEGLSAHIESLKIRIK